MKFGITKHSAVWGLGIDLCFGHKADPLGDPFKMLVRFGPYTLIIRKQRWFYVHPKQLIEKHTPEEQLAFEIAFAEAGLRKNCQLRDYMKPTQPTPTPPTKMYGKGMLAQGNKVLVDRKGAMKKRTQTKGK